MERVRSIITCGGGRTKQAFRAECDLNAIVDKAKRQAKKSGLPLSSVSIAGSSRQPFFADVVGTPSDFQVAMNLVLQSQAQFNALPAKVRARFNNNPAALVDFVSDEANRAEAVALGLIEEVGDGNIDNGISVALDSVAGQDATKEVTE